jgi:hypothetical protein
MKISKSTIVVQKIANTILCLLLFFSAEMAYAQKKLPVKTGENFITLDGERFHNEKLVLSPHLTGYDNLWFDNGKQKFTDIDLVGKYDGRAVDFQLRFPGQLGTYTIEDNKTSTGSQRNDDDCYLLMKDKDVFGDGLGAQPGSIKVIVTRYDNVGGLVEGNISGKLASGDGTKNNISISGSFSFVREKDRKSF